jgi:CBS domain-containing membrane protein
MGKTGEQLSLKTRWQFWRARMSTPALLSRYDEKKAISLLTAINGGLAILTVGLLAWLTNLPLVFPALGPSTFILYSAPLSKAGAPRSVVLGHFICLLCGYVTWYLMGFISGGPVTLETGGWPLFASATVALACSCFFLLLFNCPHPPACASSLVVALGMITGWFSIFLMGLVVMWLAFQAVLMNRFAGLPSPIWSPLRRENL